MRAFHILVVFLSGAVVAINLSRLIPTNEAYDAQWWKIGLALVFAAVNAVLALSPRRHNA